MTSSLKNVFQADSVEAVCEAVRTSDRLMIVAGRSKKVCRQSNEADCNPNASQDPACSILDMSHFSGIVEYDPSEFTITARAGTRISEMQTQLGKNGQFIPFDPPLAAAGATLGGTIAAGISGPSRLRFGGVRDFIIGIKLVDGTGLQVTGGGKVVKNAAGFDTPKMMVGSWGELGVLTEVTLKIFPRPSEYCTVRIEGGSLPNAISMMNRLAGAPLDLEALDLEADGTLLARIGGMPEAIKRSAERVMQNLDGKSEWIEPGSNEESIWSVIRDWTWQSPSGFLVRIPIISSRIAALDQALAIHEARRRYSVAGNVAWVSWPAHEPMDALRKVLVAQKLTGRILRAPISSQNDCDPSGAQHFSDRTQLGIAQAEAFARKIKRALDPDHRFAERV